MLEPLPARGMGEAGSGCVAVCLFFAAFTTLVGWYFFASQNIKYLFGYKFLNTFSVIVLCFIMLGSFLKVDLVWELTDLFNGFMVIPNIIAIVCLYKLVGRACRDFEQNFDQDKQCEFGSSAELTCKLSPSQEKEGAAQTDAEQQAPEEK